MTLLVLLQIPISSHRGPTHNRRNQSPTLPILILRPSTCPPGPAQPTTTQRWIGPPPNPNTAPSTTSASAPSRPAPASTKPQPNPCVAPSGTKSLQHRPRPPNASSTPQTNLGCARAPSPLQETPPLAPPCVGPAPMDPAGPHGSVSLSRKRPSAVASTFGSLGFLRQKGGTTRGIRCLGCWGRV